MISVEIRAAEGGDDAKLLVAEMLRIYVAATRRAGATISVKESTAGRIVFFAPDDTRVFFSGEGGGHRWQRIPPTERNGRVHTSTVTVAVLDQTVPHNADIFERDLKWEFFSAGGPGGQHQNKTASAARVRHRPSGLVVECREERDQRRNKDRCLKKLRQKLLDGARRGRHLEANLSRRSQVGSGQRGDKIRTYRVQDGIVTDHRSGAKTTLAKLISGDWGDLK